MTRTGVRWCRAAYVAGAALVCVSLTTDRPLLAGVSLAVGVGLVGGSWLAAGRRQPA